MKESNFLELDFDPYKKNALNISTNLNGHALNQMVTVIDLKHFSFQHTLFLNIVSFVRWSGNGNR